MHEQSGETDVIGQMMRSVEKARRPKEGVPIGKGKVMEG